MWLLKDLMSDGLGRFVPSSIIMIFILMGFSVKWSLEELRARETFKVNHACEIVAHKKGQILVNSGVLVVGSSPGVVMTSSSSPDQTAWLCDDNVMYWR